MMPLKDRTAQETDNEEHTFSPYPTETISSYQEKKAFYKYTETLSFKYHCKEKSSIGGDRRNYENCRHFPQKAI